MAMNQMILIKKYLITEMEIGVCDDENIRKSNFENFKIIFQNNDTTIVTAISEGEIKKMIFKK